MITKCFKKIERYLEAYGHIVEDYILNKQIFTREKGAIDGEVFFIDESRLDFLEVVNTNKPAKAKYRYHFMDEANKMVFRYDNARHHPELKTFPNHKHTQDGSVFENGEPDIKEILVEIEKHILG